MGKTQNTCGNGEISSPKRRAEGRRGEEKAERERERETAGEKRREFSTIPG